MLLSHLPFVPSSPGQGFIHCPPCYRATQETKAKQYQDRQNDYHQEAQPVGLQRVHVGDVFDLDGEICSHQTDWQKQDGGFGK